MDMPIRNVVRYTRPSKMDRMPFCTHWVYQDENDEEEHYIQTSSKENEPEWVRAGLVLERCFTFVYEDPGFVEEIVESFKKKRREIPATLQKHCS